MAAWAKLSVTKNDKQTSGRSGGRFAKGNAEGGRTAGSRNVRTAEVIAELKARGDMDALLILSTLANDEVKPDDIRLRAAHALAPFCHSKAHVRVNPEPATLPSVSTPQEAAEALESVAKGLMGGQLDLDTGNAVIAALRALSELRSAADLEARMAALESQQ